MSRPIIIINPGEALVDRDVNVKIKGFDPEEKVEVQAESIDVKGQKWRSAAVFQTDENGEVDLGKTAPISGDYTGARPMGLFTSMKAGPDGDYHYTLDPAKITITATAEDKSASAVFTQRYVSQDVKVEEIKNIDDHGIFGEYFYKASQSPGPAVLVLGGSSGFSWTRNMAALLASNGFPSMALHYFGKKGLPPMLSLIPLEYFQKAIKWLEERDEVDKGRISAVGISKGAELALLLGSMFLQIKAVVGYAPFSSAMQGLAMKQESTWTYRGEQVPFLSVWDYDGLFEKEPSGPISFRDFYLNNYKRKPEEAEKAAIKVEKTNGPVLVISGKDDRAAPSDYCGERIVERLSKAGFSHKYEHLCFKDAGHSLGYVNTPSTVTRVFIPTMGFHLDLGGDPQKTADARSSAWKKVMEYLNMV